MDTNSIYTSALAVAKTITDCCKTKEEAEQLIELVQKIVEARDTIQTPFL